MVSFDKNPYAWNNETDIIPTVASLSLSNDNGSVIPVENLSEEIEVSFLMVILKSQKHIMMLKCQNRQQPNTAMHNQSRHRMIHTSSH